MNIAVLLDAATLPYLVALGFSVVLALLSGISVASHGGHADAGIGHGHVHLPHAHLPHVHPDTGAHVSHDVAHAGHDLAHTTAGLHQGHAGHHGNSAEAEQQPGTFQRLAGLSNVPLLLVLQAFIFLWGLLGIAANMTWAGQGLPLAASTWLTLAVATAGSLVLTRLLLIPLGRLMPPPIETYAIDLEDLVGCTAVLTYRIEPGHAGTAHVHDAHGNLYQVTVRLGNLADPVQGTIPAGSELLLTGYNPEEMTYSAVISPLWGANSPGHLGADSSESDGSAGEADRSVQAGGMGGEG